VRSILLVGLKFNWHAESSLTVWIPVYSERAAREMQKPQTLIRLWTGEGAFAVLTPNYLGLWTWLDD
jgi:hypothetical protein